ncbi:MAG: hypothetical protein LBD93_01785 [Treponema sp.]|jgi:hypothetical protein|nr:hypothetical protein [Treponema sp.]
MKIDPGLNNLKELFPLDFTGEERENGQRLFLKNLALEAHRFYRGKI